MKYRSFIQDSFSIDEPKQGKIVPFIFRPVQSRYYDMLCQDYGGETTNFIGAREVILKARRLGWSSMVLGLFAADMILSKNPVQYLCLSYKEDATKKLFKRFKLFLESYCQKKGIDFRQFVKTDNRHEIELSHNRSYFYIGSASAKVGERGGTCQGIHFSECAHYPDTEIMTAQEIIEASMRMVDIDSGWVFVESTANGFGNYYQRMWDLAEKGESRFKPRFFGWKDYYTPEQFSKIASEFVDKEKLKQEYPETAEQAFLSSGRPFFNLEVLKWYESICTEPIKRGYLLAGDPPSIDDNPRGYWKFWELPQDGEQYMISVDIGLKHDYSSAGILKRKSMELVATLHGHLDSGELAQNIAMAGQWFNNALVIPEKNGLGMGVLTALKGLQYGNLYRRRTFDRISNTDRQEEGWMTTSSSRPLMLADLQTAISEKTFKIYDLDCIKEMKTFVRSETTGRPEAEAKGRDDRVIMLAILARVVQEIPLISSQDYRMPPDQAKFDNWSATPGSQSKDRSVRIGL